MTAFKVISWRPKLWVSCWLWTEKQLNAQFENIYASLVQFICVCFANKQIQRLVRDAIYRRAIKLSLHTNPVTNCICISYFYQTLSWTHSPMLSYLLSNKCIVHVLYSNLPKNKFFCLKLSLNYCFSVCKGVRNARCVGLHRCKSCRHRLEYRAFSLTWPASMLIYWSKRKHLHEKRVKLPEDFLGTPTWPPFHCFGTPIWPPWRHVKTLYISYPTRTRGIIVKYYREKDMAPPSIRETMGFEIQIRDICTPDTSKEGFRYMEDTISGYHYPFRTATYRVRFIF